MSPSQMLHHYRRGKSLQEIADLSGLSRYQVYRRIKDERWRQGEVVISEKELKADILKGLTVRQLAEKHMCSIGCISKKRKRIMRQHDSVNKVEKS